VRSFYQLASLSFIAGGLFADLFIVRLMLTFAYTFMLANVLAGFPSWPRMTQDEPFMLSVDAVAWAILGVYVHGSSLFRLLYEERHVSLAEDEEVGRPDSVERVVGGWLARSRWVDAARIGECLSVTRALRQAQGITRRCSRRPEPLIAAEDYRLCAAHPPSPVCNVSFLPSFYGTPTPLTTAGDLADVLSARPHLPPALPDPDSTRSRVPSLHARGRDHRTVSLRPPPPIVLGRAEQVQWM
jgi:hypothetical protein